MGRLSRYQWKPNRKSGADGAAGDYDLPPTQQAVPPTKRNEKRRKHEEKSNGATNASDQDVPFAFRRARILMEREAERARDKKRAARMDGKTLTADSSTTMTSTSSTTTASTSAKSSTTANQKSGIRPGESMRDYSERVDMAANEALRKAIHDGSDFGAKRKQKFKEAMARKREKLQTERNGHSDKLTPKERALAERGTVRFGDVALAPPVISVKPKERHTRVKLPSKPRQNDVEEDVCEDEFDSDAVDGSSDKKTKKKRTLSLHQKQQMEIERRNAVRLYRLQKEMMKGEK